MVNRRMSGGVKSFGLDGDKRGESFSNCSVTPETSWARNCDGLIDELLDGSRGIGSNRRSSWKRRSNELATGGEGSLKSIKQRSSLGGGLTIVGPWFGIGGAGAGRVTTAQSPRTALI